MTVLGRFWAARLGFANSSGFGLTTIMPLWAASLGPVLHASTLVIASAAAAQILTCAVVNLLSPLIFRARDTLTIAKGALLIAACGAVAQALLPLPMFLLGALVSGASVGVLLACTNRLAAGAKHVQEGYATFQIVEVTFAGCLLVLAGPFVAAFGVRSVFWCLGASQLLGYLAVRRLVTDEPAENVELPHVQGVRNWRGWAFLVLVAIFFSGQSSIVSHLVPIGHGAGIGSGLIATVMSVGVFCGFIGAMAARLIGSRFGVARPIVMAGICFATDLAFLGGSQTPLQFTVEACLVQVGTFFLLPYFFTLLAKSDAQGQHVAVAPAFILVGVAAGPVVAALLSDQRGTLRLGETAAALVIMSTIMLGVLSGGRSQRATRSSGRLFRA